MSANTLPRNAPTTITLTPGRPTERRELTVDAADDHEGDCGTGREHRGIGDRVDVAQQAIGSKDVHRVDAGGRQRERQAEDIGAHGAAADQRDPTENRDERSEPLGVQPLATRERRDSDDHGEMAVVQERRERRRRPLERGVEEERVGRVEHEAERERGQRDPKRKREQRTTRDDRRARSLR